MKSNMINAMFTPGDEWFFVKIYTGYITADEILLKVISPLSKFMLKEKCIDKWFFIRYEDEGHHLRVRFRLLNNNNISLLLERLNLKVNYYISSGLIWKIQIDTYKRELKRYGFDLINLSEEYFFINSQQIVEILKISKKFSIDRWKFAFPIVDSILEDFRFSLEGKYQMLKELNDSYLTEFDINKDSYKQFGSKHPIKYVL